MKTIDQVDEKLAKSLTAETTDLLPYLPYLLQDLWELGSQPQSIIDLISKNIPLASNTTILDLACGKGAVSVKLAEALNVNVRGVDIVPEFIEFAKKKAEEQGVTSLCLFAVEDINKTISTTQSYDGVILGAVGDVLGSPKVTLEKLKSVIKTDGFIIIDDAYLKPDENEQSNYSGNEYLTYAQWLDLFKEVGLTLVDSASTDDMDDDINDYNTKSIVRRANELIKKHPDKKALFEGYIKSQELECDDLENILTGVTWLLRNKI
ncbi:class I SAM-dependent methyltransferase [Oscillospiraceae bacterium LTW-04]|nr:methyltransferase domain-containing protein [Oscillospiraceae bacterium MB24-C1]